MVFKRALDVSSNEESAKISRLDSNIFLKRNENKPELIDLTEEQDQAIELDPKLDIMAYACRNGDLEIVELFLKHNFDVNSRDSSNNTALHHAAANDQLEIVKKLLQNGALPNLANTANFTPLHLASLNGHTQVLRELLHKKVDVNLEAKHGENALSFSARNGHLCAVKELLNSGAKSYIEDGDSSSFNVLEKLPSILSENHIEIAAEILKRHPLPIHQAIEQLQRPEAYLIIRHLFKYGISPDLKDRNGKTALHRAILKEVNSQTFVELLEHGVNMEIEDIDNKSPLLLAIEQSKYEFVKTLLRYGANPNHQRNDGFGSTLLHEACLNGKLSLTKILLEHGADVNALDNHKQTPINLAIIEGNFDEQKIEVIKKLLQNGANVNLKDSDGYITLHSAAFHKTMPEDLFQDILKRCTNLDVKHLEGQTPLHIAAIREGCQLTVKNLLRYGADANVKNFEGYSSFEHSLTCDQMDTFKVLIYNN